MRLRASAMMQLRCITALLRRRVRTEFRGTRSGYLWALFEPIVFTMFLKIMIQHQGNGKPPLGDSYEVFFATGFTLARTWRQTTGQITAALARETLNSLPTIFRMDLVVAVATLEMLTAFTVLFIILSILQIFGMQALPYDLLGCLIALFLTIMMALSLGLVISLLEVVIPAISRLRNIILLPLYVLSGFAFLIDRMPPQFAEILAWNPVLHCVTLFRESFYRGYECRYLSESYLFGWIFAGITIGMLSERAFRRKQRRVTMYSDEAQNQEI